MSPQEQIDDLAGRLRDSLLAHRTVPKQRGVKWRKLRVQAIEEFAQTPDSRSRLAKYIGRSFGAVLLTELSDTELDRTHREVASW